MCWAIARAAWIMALAILLYREGCNESNLESKTMTKDHVFKMSADEYDMMKEESGGYCLDCLTEASGVEPDAREYTCEECSEPRVFGIEELLMMGLVEITDGDEPEGDE